MLSSGTITIAAAPLPVERILKGLQGSPTTFAWMILGILCGAMLVLVIQTIISLYKRFKNWRQSRGRSGPIALSSSTLLDLWKRFLKNLPRSTRPLVARYPAAVVMGPVGSGKSQVVRSFVDWQGQTSQFLPSLTDSPLLQIYLGGKLLVEELSAQLLTNTSAVAGEALSKLWHPLTSEQAPMALVVLKLTTLESASAEEREELAHQVRGKLAALHKLVGAPVETRLCLTHLDQVRGFAQTARFCAAHRIPLFLPVPGGAGGDEKKATELASYLPLALTKLPAADFREVVLFLQQVPRLYAALEGFWKPLRQWSIGSTPPILERLYLYSNQQGINGSNPFANRRFQPVSSIGARLKAALPPWLRGAQWHLIGSAALVALVAIICIGAALRQSRAVHHAEDAVEEFAQVVHRAQVTLGDVRDSAAVRSASHAAREAIEVIAVTEHSWILHRLMYRGAKVVLTHRLLDTTRRAYFFPLLPVYGAQRDIERTLYLLAVLYATRDNALGSIVASELQEISRSLGINPTIIVDYVQLSDEPFDRAAAVPWRRLVSAEAPATANADTWLHYFLELQQVYRSQSVTAEQLRRLQQEALPLLKVADAVRIKRKLAQIVAGIEEESPLVEIRKELGSRYLELGPPQWLRDQQAAISGVLHMVHDTDQQAVRAGQLSLVQVLRLLTDLDQRKRSEDQVYSFEINERVFSFSNRAWSDMLLRGRHQLVLGALYKASDLPVESSSSSGSRSRHREVLAGAGSASAADKPARRHHRRRTHKAAASEEPSAQAPRHHSRTHDDGTAGKSLAAEEPQVSSAEARQYTRASYEADMKSLLQKLDKALGDDSGLPPAQRQQLTNYVQGEARRYAARYCAALMQQYGSYVFPGGALSSTRAAMMEMLTPSGSLLTHLKAVSDNANLSGLDGRFTQPLGSCLTQLKPVVNLMTPGKDGTYAGLKPYSEIIGGVIKDLDNGKPGEPKEDGKPLGLSELLSPLGRLGLAALTEQDTSPERKVLQFLEASGLSGPLAPPFLAPLKHLAKLGQSEVEQTLAQQWENTLQPMVRPILSRYPFERRSERELQPSELDVIKPGSGPYWSTFRQIFGPVTLEQNKSFSARHWPRGALALPKDLLPLTNELNTLASALFLKDGTRKPIEVAVRALPVGVCDPQNPAAASFLKIGKAQVFGVNTRPALTTLPVAWWQQDIASVGLEYAGSGSQRTAQSIEVADSLWNFFRLLERASATRNTLTWSLPAEGRSSTCEIRFELEPNPMTLFRIR